MIEYFGHIRLNTTGVGHNLLLHRGLQDNGLHDYPQFWELQQVLQQVHEHLLILQNIITANPQQDLPCRHHVLLSWVSLKFSGLASRLISTNSDLNLPPAFLTSAILSTRLLSADQSTSDPLNRRRFYQPIHLKIGSWLLIANFLSHISSHSNVFGN